MPFGLGPIGASVARQIVERPGFKIVGAIDIDPAKVGRDVGEVIGLSRRLRSKVSAAAADALRVFPAGEIVIATHPEGRSNWLARSVVERVRRRFGLAVAHLVVDRERRREYLEAA